MILMVPFEP
ncbi:hypothetical protein CP061683_0457A, partial [Chlamydia psittaci 06-1683]